MSKSKRKGSAGEREVVEAFKLHDIPCQRVPLSGSAGGMFADDVHFRIGRETFRGEVKRRAAGFKFDYQALGESDVLFKRADRHDWLVTLRLDDFLLLIKDLANEKAERREH